MTALHLYRWQGSGALTPRERESLAAWVMALGKARVAAKAGLVSCYPVHKARAGLSVSRDTLAALRHLLASPLPAAQCRHEGCSRPVAPASRRGGPKIIHCEAHRRPPRSRYPTPVCPECEGPLAVAEGVIHCQRRRCERALRVGVL